MGIGTNIKNYIHSNTSGIFDADIKDEKYLAYFYHLSEMRKSLYNWYEFRENSSLLEIGAGFGALTGLFCEKCGKVTAVAENTFREDAIKDRYEEACNLRVVSFTIPGVSIDSPRDFYREISREPQLFSEFLIKECNEKYDYIILTGVLEQISKGHDKLLQTLSGMLKDNGRILIATENRFGLKYICGEPEDSTGVPFAGLKSSDLNGSSEIDSDGQRFGHVFSRQGISDLLSANGFSRHKFFYPLPDYRFPLQVYTDEYLPQKNIGERVLFYHENSLSLIADEKTLYSDIIDNGVFPFVANSFLIECLPDKYKKDDLSPVSFVALTTDRGPEAALTTIIKGIIVEKKALYKDGERSICEVFQNVLEMKKRGIPVIDHELKDNVISMPYITAPALMDYMRSISGDANKISQIFEQLWGLILRSSDEVPQIENKIKEYTERLADGIDGIEVLDWGPILKKVYIEMMPMNSFYIDGNIFFFDQEFSRECFPAKYAMFRTILYTYINIPEIENVLPEIEVKNKYGFDERLWNIFLAEEGRFVGSIRRLSENKFFYDRLGVDEVRMKENAERLMM